ncbi:MAG: DUF480 domain-containing protein [Planctomycetales bacterium]|nr:DUF480 domain-containing protein [Planctomycetales bacterium]
MNDTTQSQSDDSSDQPKWKPLTRTQRRVFGVLVEKAKTTPDAYPMTLNGITTGCNQKSNRSPLMNLTADEVETALDQLRNMSAVAEVQGSGRVAKYRHYAYDWLGVDKTEIAVMTELLLRGEQTVGELRGRAARMEPIADLNALKPVLDSLIEKGLVVSLTPEGRGQIVTHNLYEPHEMRHLQTKVGSMAAAAADEERAASSPPSAAPVASRPTASAPVAAPTAGPDNSELLERIDDLELQVARLQEIVQQLDARLTHIES